MHNITNYATYDLKTHPLTHADLGQMQLFPTEAALKRETKAIKHQLSENKDRE